MKSLDFAELLINAVLASFVHAYEKHAAGDSLDAILIQHDIVAAGSNVAKPIVDLHRRAIKSACAAHEAGVPLPQAAAYVMKGMVQRVNQMLAEGI